MSIHPDPTDRPTAFFLDGPAASGQGSPTDDGFIVRAGARARRDEVPSINEATVRARHALIDDGTLQEDGDGYVLTRDHVFSSPSGAAMVLLGRTANGWNEWKAPDGRSLHDIFRVTSQEPEFRRRWYEAHLARHEADAENLDASLGRTRLFNQSAAEALALRDALVRTGDVTSFHEGMKHWAPGTLAFNGFSGQMFLNQLVKRSDDHIALAGLVSNALSLPADDADAAAKVQSVVDFVETIRIGAHPAPGNSVFLLSYFWGLEDHARWPVLWLSAGSYLECSTGTSLPPSPAERYPTYVHLVRELDDDNARFERVAAWWDETKPVFLDHVLCDRAAYGLDADGPDIEARVGNADVLVSVAKYVGDRLVDDVAAAVGRSLSAKRPSRYWATDAPRSDFWADWTVPDAGGMSVRLWLNQDGAAIGVRPGHVREGWYDEAAGAIEAVPVEGLELMAGRQSTYGRDVGFAGGSSGEFVYGRWYDSGALGALDLRAEVTAVASTARPLLDELILRATGEPPPPAGDPLTPVVDEFRDKVRYPRPTDVQHRSERERFAALLAPDAIALADQVELRRIWTSRRYGGPGPQAVLNATIRDARAAEYDRFVDTVRYLSWGDGDAADRIDAVLTDPALTVRGLGESVILKLLAVAHPDRFVPVFPLSGPNGKLRMLQLLGLPEPSSDSRGRLHIQANDSIRQRLDRFFPGDPWGMAEFLYWYAEREDEPTPASDVDPLDDLAERLLVGRGFLDDVVALLEDKGQVILYGPPGTGKTYLARKLAEALVPEPSRRSLVQFHPSTSYEDFFEGYRPEMSVDGGMTYRLTPGPLALLSGRATDAPGKRHIMIIDEINRANLPKVLGELLYLFEYRDEPIPTLYRPDDPFELPKDVWFIGTMNTADRSIALVDAALRRRFHFIPIFPNHGPMAGLLERWLAANHEPAWVGELVAMVNDELTEALGGPHLQLGPSHFMKPGVDETAMRRIWEYNIEPFIEDQFFGDPAQIERFRFDRVMRRYGEQSGLDELASFVEEQEPGSASGAIGGSIADGSEASESPTST